MRIVAFMRELVAKGMSWEDAALFAEKFEDGIEEAIGRVRPAPSTNAQRQARYRARKAEAAAGVTNNVTSDATRVTKEIPPEPPKENTPIPPLKGGTFPVTSDEDTPEKPNQSLAGWAREIFNNAPIEARRRSALAKTEDALRAAVRRKAEPERISAGLNAYYASPDATKNDRQYAKGVHRAISDGLWEAYEPEPERARPPDDPWPLRMLRWRTAQYWNSEWGPKPGKPGFLGPPDEELAA